MMLGRCQVIGGPHSNRGIINGARSRRKSAARGMPALRAVKEFELPRSSWQDLDLKHVVEAQQFGTDALDVIFKAAQEIEAREGDLSLADTLKGRVIATLFYEPSTRTRLSFESAIVRLGGTVLSTESAGEYSSAAKGETLEGKQSTWTGKGRVTWLKNGHCDHVDSLGCRSDQGGTWCCADTIRTVQCYCDGIVLRHFQAGSAKIAASVADVPIINAGDGPGQHPTQVTRILFHVSILGLLSNNMRFVKFQDVI